MPKSKLVDSKSTTVWVVMHYEFLPSGNMDCMQFHVSSSLTAARRYIKRVFVAPYSWWQVHPHVIDHDDWEVDEGVETYFFDYKGKPMTRPDHQRAWRAFERAKKRGEFDVAKK